MINRSPLNPRGADDHLYPS